VRGTVEQRRNRAGHVAGLAAGNSLAPVGPIVAGSAHPGAGIGAVAAGMAKEAVGCLIQRVRSRRSKQRGRGAQLRQPDLDSAPVDFSKHRILGGIDGHRRR